ncbi:MAG TPA: DUF4865 family protein [Motilibacteraceae bacterium]|nr:DUF4865 family protein [Motilibacteraceae bacterium]
MQYEITLPADYDMQIIRDRVATRGSATDDFPGLGVKAYLVRERGQDGSPVNQYAPFYLWADPAGMEQFLFGPAFLGLCSDFGRPAVRWWTGVAAAEGPAAASAAVHATRALEPIDPSAALPDVVADLARQTADSAGRDGVVLTATGIDPSGWSIVRFTLWAAPAPGDVAGERYQVRHVSDPERAALTSTPLP